MISIKTKIDSFDLKLLKNYVHNLPAATTRKLYNIILMAAIETAGEAKESILTGTRTGRIYRRKGGKIHQASAPGEHPMSDSGDLQGSIFYDGSRNKLRATVGSIIKHGLFTEEGTKNMKRRPWLEPSVAASRPMLEKRIFELGRQI